MSLETIEIKMAAVSAKRYDLLSFQDFGWSAAIVKKEPTGLVKKTMMDKNIEAHYRHDASSTLKAVEHFSSPYPEAILVLRNSRKSLLGVKFRAAAIWLL